ncbi:MAG: hypothetical protein A3D92_18290, partial [Bacteroidetes bacterium RIFCSPHIGHO2_02_FULL_44_7]
MIPSLKTYSPLILFIFHFFGVLLFLYNPQSAQLSFLTIILCGLLILLHEKESRNYMVYLAIALAGYLVEIIGVNTHYLFGSYTYGDSLGIKLFNVPPLIGLNWLVIVISGASIARRLFHKKPLWFIALISALICTFLDVIIEPVAVKFNFWVWDSGSIPVYNYIC